jgi:putative ABC transport system permease protein
MVRDSRALAIVIGRPGIEKKRAVNATMWSFAWQNLVTRPTRTALAVLGLTIPVLAFLGLFSLSGGIRHLMGDTLASMQNLMVLRENAPAPVFSDLPPETGDALRKVPGVRVVAAEVWKVAPPIDGHGGGGLGAAALGMLTKPKDQGFKSLLNMIAVEGQDIREHAKLKSATINRSILPAPRKGVAGC